MARKVNVLGVGIVDFAKPGKSDPYNVMASTASKRALADANVAYDEIEQAFAGYVYGDSTCGQRALYDVGLTGIPVFNVNNNCVQSRKSPDILSCFRCDLQPMPRGIQVEFLRRVHTTVDGQKVGSSVTIGMGCILVIRVLLIQGNSQLPA